jgi:hypothetical protein
MTENKILNKTLELLDNQGIHEAYDYLQLHKQDFDTLSSQYYNYLYCLAALDDKPNEALHYLEEAIIGKELWYRPEVLEDEDLDSIRDTDRFKTAKQISDKRYHMAMENTQTLSTWNAKKKERLILALHGNQQSIKDSQEDWAFLEKLGYQVEYVQSEEIDSCGIYRWEDEGTGSTQLKKVIDAVEWSDYQESGLCGFSSGCNVILKAILDYDFPCNTIILQSPWIPMIDDSLETLTTKVIELKTEVLIICGREDEDCFERSQALYLHLKEQGVDVRKQWIDGLGHELPEGHDRIVKQLLEMEDGD